MSEQHGTDSIVEGAIEVLHRLKRLSDLASREVKIPRVDLVAAQCSWMGADSAYEPHKPAPLVQCIKNMHAAIIDVDHDSFHGTVILTGSGRDTSQIALPLDVFDSSLEKAIDLWGTTDYPSLAPNLRLVSNSGTEL